MPQAFTPAYCNPLSTLLTVPIKKKNYINMLGLALTFVTFSLLLINVGVDVFVSDAR